MTEHDLLIENDECETCWQLRFEAPDPHRYVIVPSEDGGWKGWAGWVASLLRRVGDDPLQVFIAHQPQSGDRYLQGLIGHGLAWVEVSSNHYLTGASLLTAADEDRLLMLGWRRPSPVNVERGLTNNWWQPLVHGTWPQLACLLATTAAMALRFSEHQPVELETFAADHPCRACAWGDDISEWS